MHKMTQRIILHLDMDAFFAAIEERENPHFRGKPLVVGADPKEGRGRGVVSTANYAARKYGIHSAMPISQAFRLCPQAIFLPVNGEFYQQVSENIMKILRGAAPVVEQVSLDEAYLDTSYLKSYQKTALLAETLKKEIFETERLMCTCGIGSNKMIAKIACEKNKPDGLGIVTAQEAEKFLEPLDIEDIPGIGSKTAAILRGSQFQKVQDLKRLSQEDFGDLFGIRGEEMYWKIRGVDNDPVVAEREIKSIGKEYTFERDTRDPELLIQTFEKLCWEVAAEVRAQKFLFRTIAVKCRFRGFETHTKSRTLMIPCDDVQVFYSEAMKLFLGFIVQSAKPIRLIGARAVVALKVSV